MKQIEIPNEPEMHRRRIELSDGRYLVFYTFETAEAEDPRGSANEGENASES